MIELKNGVFKNRTEVIKQALEDAIAYNESIINRVSSGRIKDASEETILTYKKLLEEFES